MSNGSSSSDKVPAHVSGMSDSMSRMYGNRSPVKHLSLILDHETRYFIPSSPGEVIGGVIGLFKRIKCGLNG